MIKQLIRDLAYENIQLSQGLTRAKIIAGKIKNEALKNWIKKELEGYEHHDDLLPPYRKVWTQIILNLALPYGRTDKITVILPEGLDEEFRELIEYHQIIESIAIVEKQINSIQDSKGYLTMHPQHTSGLASLYEDTLIEQRARVISGQRIIGKISYQNVIEQTKQKLLDTLIELDAEFPNLEDDKVMSKEDSLKAHNIITNHIYGNNNPLNLAAGLNVTQNVNYYGISKEDEEKLSQLGVEQKDIEELKIIVNSNSNDKPSLREKAMKWLSGASASVATKGLSDNLPQIINFIQDLVV